MTSAATPSAQMRCRSAGAAVLLLHASCSRSDAVLAGGSGLFPSRCSPGAASPPHAPPSRPISNADAGRYMLVAHRHEIAPASPHPGDSHVTRAAEPRRLAAEPWNNLRFASEASLPSSAAGHGSKFASFPSRGFAWPTSRADVSSRLPNSRRQFRPNIRAGVAFLTSMRMHRWRGAVVWGSPRTDMRNLQSATAFRATSMFVSPLACRKEI